MTAAQVIEEIEAAGGTLTLNEGRIRYAVPKQARTLLDVVKERRAEVLRVLQERQERTCYVHGGHAIWWERPTGGLVCGLCHPDPSELAAQRAHRQAVKDAQNTEPPPMPPGVTLLERKLKSPPVALYAWMVVNDVPQFERTTLAQLDAVLRSKNWLAGNWSVRDLVERLEQVGVRVQVTQ